jgi:hypothetical protein
MQTHYLPKGGGHYRLYDSGVAPDRRPWASTPAHGCIRPADAPVQARPIVPGRLTGVAHRQCSLAAQALAEHGPGLRVGG